MSSAYYMKSKYNGRCPKCGEKIEKGDFIYYVPDLSVTLCQDCEEWAGGYVIVDQTDQTKEGKRR